MNQLKNSALVVCALSMQVVCAAVLLAAPPERETQTEGKTQAERETQVTSPATIAQATKHFDLATFPLMENFVQPPRRRLASLTYQVRATPKAAFEFQRKQLLERHWLELPQSHVSDQSASGTFAHEGYKLSVMIIPGADGQQTVIINNHGNVALDLLPIPPGAKLFSNGPVSTLLISDASVEATVAACKKQLADQGWKPYGEAGDSLMFKQNAVQLMATIQSAPAQGGRTMIDYSSSLMSADLPAPAETTQLHYADSTTALNFDTGLINDKVFDFYRAELAAAGWKPTTEQPIKNGLESQLLFGDAVNNMLSLTVRDMKNGSRVSLRFQSAAEIAEMRKADKAERETKQAEKAQPAATFSVAMPTGAKDIQASKDQIRFKITSGAAKAAVEAWRKTLVADGWKEQTASLQKLGGTVSFGRGADEMLIVIYTDTGFVPAEITLHAHGVELAKPAEKK